VAAPDAPLQAPEPLDAAAAVVAAAPEPLDAVAARVMVSPCSAAADR